jgi:MFS family permease/nicotinamidase-related amidase
VSGRYKWFALSNTTLGVLMSTINMSIVIIALPDIFRGIHINPLQPGNISYLLWIIMGYILTQAVLVVTLGRLGDMFGRVKIYNAGFAVFTIGSIALAFDPLQHGGGALWLILWRIMQGVGGAMLSANSTAILTDAFPARRRGLALGINQIAGIGGSFLGFIIGGLLAPVHWRLVFFVSVPIGLIGTVWAYKSLREIGHRVRARIDWWGNLLFAVGLTATLVGITYGIQPYGGHPEGWTNPMVLGAIIGGFAVLAVFCVVETKVAQPMFHLGLYKIRAFWTGNLASLLSAVGRGGLQFMLIIWLQGIWLPLHGYNFVQTPLWAAIYMVPITIGFLIAGPASGALSDRVGARTLATGGLLVVAATFVGLLAIPTDFTYWQFGLILFISGIGSGLFAAPNTTAIMNSVPADQRGQANGMRTTLMNSGMALSIGIFFSLMTTGLAAKLPHSLASGLIGQGVPHGAAQQIAGLPPIGTLFAAFLGYNPIGNLLPQHVQHALSTGQLHTLLGKQFFPHLIAQPFHHGLAIAFAAAAAMSVAGAIASALRGGIYYHESSMDPKPVSEAAADSSDTQASPASGEPSVSDAATVDHNGHRVNGHRPNGHRAGDGSGPAAAGEAAGRSKPAPLPASGTALVVLDMQQGIVERASVPDPVLEAAQRAVRAARAAGIPVVYVRAAFRDRTPEISPRNRSFAPLSGTNRMRETDPGTRIHPSVSPQPGDVIVTKRRISAFAGSDLDVVLRSAGVSCLVLAGVATSGAVLSTLRQAADQDFVLTVLRDACADRDSEVGRVLMEKVFPTQAAVTTVDEWESGLASATTPAEAVVGHVPTG